MRAYAKSVSLDRQVRLGMPEHYRDLLTSRNFDVQLLTRLTDVRSGRALLDFSLTLATLLAVPFLLHWALNPLTVIVAVLANLRVMNCFAQFVHYSDHAALFKSKWGDEIAARLAAGLLGSPRTPQSTANHLQHHLYTNTDRDPDRIWGTPEQSARQIWWDAVKIDFSCSWAFRRIARYLNRVETTAKEAENQRQSNSRSRMHGVVGLMIVAAAQLSVLCVYAATVGWLAYFIFWFAPLIAIYPAILRLRRLVEHGFEWGYVPVSPSDRWVTRSSKPWTFSHFILSPLGTEYHFEHHLFPQVPYYNLIGARQLLLQHGVPIPKTPGYLSFAWQKYQAELGGAA